MKQKRQLIESLKEKESSQQQLVEECQGKMVREEVERGGEGEKNRCGGGEDRRRIERGEDPKGAGEWVM